MTKKQIETLKNVMVITMQSEFLSADRKMKEVEKFNDFMKMIFDFHIVDKYSNIEKIRKEVLGAALEAN